VRQPRDPPDERSDGVAVVLRRLANPYLPFDGQRSAPGTATANFTYNPFLTVDYIESVPLQAVNGTAAIASTGKLQPYAAYRGTLQPQTGQQHPVVQCTFGRPNVPAPPTYDALTHIDRAPISPLELLNVSGYQPYQLTQRFLGPDANGTLMRFGHRAPWLDDDPSLAGTSRRLYRLFEFLETRPPVPGAPVLGRSPGKVNLNTIWDPEVLQALCDLQPGSSVTAATVNDLFSRVLYDSTATIAGPGRRTQT
jgi:hypothetical protein